MIQWLRLGGWPMGLLLVLSLVAATVIIVKLWEFWEWRASRADLAARSIEAWRRQRPEQALAQLNSERSPFAAVLSVALTALADPALSAEQARERVEQAAVHSVERLRSGLRALELIAQLAPLLGLLGTVLGMIAAFQAMQSAGGDANPALLAGGIWQALLTTAAGLTVAIPVMAILSAFEQAAERHRLSVEEAVTALMTLPRH